MKTDCDYCDNPDEYPTEGMIVHGEVVDVCVRCRNSVCQLCGDEVDKVDHHHASYLFDIMIKVCKPCHRKIHNEEGFNDELEPTFTRNQAKNLAWVLTPTDCPELYGL